MQTGIGPTLRQARKRRKVELPEVEAATKIRVRYLRAMENEEWGILPGEAYARSFLRTYASFLGLDGDRLVDELRRGFAADQAPRGEPAAPRPPRRGPRLPPRLLAAIVSIGLVAALVAVGLSSGGEESTTPAKPGKRADRQRRQGGETAPEKAKKPGVSVHLVANAEVWVCMLDAGGRRLVDGQILEAGAEEGPFHSGSFTISFGNGEVSVRIDGREESIPPSASPVGYTIDSGGGLRELSESERPTCT